MAKKKKTALKPVARGFATTSQPKKKVEEPEPEAEEAPSADKAADQDEGAARTVDGSVAGGAGQTNALEEWEVEVNAAESRLQGYVERLQDKGDKEVARIIKAIDFDKRMTKGLISIDLAPEVREEALAIRLEQENVRSLAKPIDVNNQAAKEKALLRLYITNKVLLKLGYTESRILECLEALGPRLVSGDDKITGGWEDALDWMWLHCSEDELKAVTA